MRLSFVCFCASFLIHKITFYLSLFVVLFYFEFLLLLFNLFSLAIFSATRGEFSVFFWDDKQHWLFFSFFSGYFRFCWLKYLLNLRGRERKRERGGVARIRVSVSLTLSLSSASLFLCLPAFSLFNIQCQG